MKRLVTVVTLAVLLVGSVVLGLGDTAPSVANTGILENDVASSVAEASNSSVSATVTITMYTVSDK